MSMTFEINAHWSLNMSILKIVVAALIFFTSLLSAQSNAGRPRYPKEGKVILHLEPVNLGRSLNELMVGSTLIVDATVTSVLPPINMSSTESRPMPMVETHSVVTIGSILKGSVPKAAATILVAQIGGQAGGWDVSVDGDTPLERGERYILFLQPDERKEPSNTSGLPRYSVVGIWAGKAKIVGGKVALPTNASQQLQRYNMAEVSAFVQEIKDRAAGKYVPSESDRGLPPHPGPPTARHP